jgi:hypothetical protein
VFEKIKGLPKLGDPFRKGLLFEKTLCKQHGKGFL